MKKYILLFILSLIFQGIFSQGLKMGVFADPLITWMVTDADNITNDGVRMGVNIGLSVEKYFAENYAFSTGLFISNCGGRLQYSDTTTFETGSEHITINPNSIIKYKLQYISVPLGLKLKSDEIGYTTFYADLGMLPQVNIKAIADGDSLSNANVSDDIAFFNLSYYIGAGIEYSLGGKTSLTTGIKYTNGFLDVSSLNGYRATTKSVSLRLGIIF
ncbi:MAG: PorT family protein [Bacteroidales bacterium]|nr:PorT family protein [Bacteroidales bacterium]